MGQKQALRLQITFSIRLAGCRNPSGDEGPEEDGWRWEEVRERRVLEVEEEGFKKQARCCC